MNQYWNNTLKYIRKSDGKNVDLTSLRCDKTVCGIVLHDDREAFIQADKSLIEAGYKPVAVPSKARLKSWTVDTDLKRVLLLESGMGSMNASIVIHELAAELIGWERADTPRIIKIGTCGGLHEGQPAGSVFVPDCALEDEGASKWNVDELDKDWEAGIEEKHILASADGSRFSSTGWLTREWRSFLEDRYSSESALLCQENPLKWWSGFRQSKGAELSSCVWTTDTFHARRVHSKRIFDFIKRKHEPNRLASALIGIENECSSHFSAASRLDMKIAAALVVSWSHDRVTSIYHGNDFSRPEKDYVHRIEGGLIVKAVEFLLSESNSPTLDTHAGL